MTPQEFAKKWQQSRLRERAGSQEHFADLCRMIGHATPAQADPKGEFFTFDKGLVQDGGQTGWADVWYKGHFAWEYKGRHKDLDAAYGQLKRYREDLENPPLLITSDMDRFEVHCNFWGSARRAYCFDLATLAQGDRARIVPEPESAAAPPALQVLRAAFTDPAVLRPQTRNLVTEAVADWIGKVGDELKRRKISFERSARFLTKVIFCFFAEDVGLLPNTIFKTILDKTRKDPDNFQAYTRQLFGAMGTGGHVLLERIPHFDGGLFADDEVLRLVTGEIDLLCRAADMDWSSVEPAVFGTLLERLFDPEKRHQIGCHYTKPEDIEEIVRPVVGEPLLGEWDSVAGAVAEAGQDRKKIAALLGGFQDRLCLVRVLDPACGSGNFLYASLRVLMDLEKKVVNLAFRHGVELPFKIRPTQLHGVELNVFAHELASVVVWIGYLQWLRENGMPDPAEPILEPIETIHLMDAIVAEGKEGPAEPPWPDGDFIVGNPPFLGGKKLRTELGDEYVERMFGVWKGRVPREADLCCYWFEKTRAYIERESGKGHHVRAGLLATQGIRGGANRKVLRRIKETGDIFMAWSDRKWTLEGAAVHVSMIGFDDGTQTARTLDKRPATRINPDLSAGADTTTALRLAENFGLSFMGDTKGGPFDIDPATAERLLAMHNPHHRPNADVIRPWVNGKDITARRRGMWIIDFGCGTDSKNAALYEGPFEYLREHVKPLRDKNKRPAYRDKWWLHVEPRPAMREAIANLNRYVATPRVAKHRLFTWLPVACLPDCALIAFARQDDYFFGVLHSRVHEVWALEQGTQLESRPRYTPTTSFETFAFPWPLDTPVPPAGQEAQARIAAVAKRLNDLRDEWLNPPAGSLGAPELKRRTLTVLYNRRPQWLADAHAELDAAVLDAYGWPPDLTDDAMLENLLELNLSRTSAR